MRPIEDLTGRRFGKLVVTSFVERRKSGSCSVSIWSCRCDCGGEKLASGVELKRGSPFSCGCSNTTALKDLSGSVFGDWTVIERASNKSGRRSAWLCQCKCGTRAAVASIHLVKGASRSCGCDRPKGPAHKKWKHGGKGTRLYRTWCNMIQRCENPNNSQYKDYGGRGITICKEWRQDFFAYQRDIGEPPSPECNTVDRIDNDKGYEPGNCRWATRTQQSRNRRGRHLVTYKGRTMPLSEAVELTGVNYGTAKWRLQNGRGIDEALEP